MPRLALALLLALSVTGCKSKCRQLSEKICECAGNTYLKDNCNRQAGNSEARLQEPLTAADEARCEGLLKGCDCNLIDTPEGKKACGLAR